MYIVHCFRYRAVDEFPRNLGSVSPDVSFWWTDSELCSVRRVCVHRFSHRLLYRSIIQPGLYLLLGAVAVVLPEELLELRDGGGRVHCIVVA